MERQEWAAGLRAGRVGKSGRGEAGGRRESAGQGAAPGGPLPAGSRPDRWGGRPPRGKPTRLATPRPPTALRPLRHRAFFPQESPAKPASLPCNVTRHTPSSRCCWHPWNKLHGNQKAKHKPQLDCAACFLPLRTGTGVLIFCMPRSSQSSAGTRESHQFPSRG